jgi:hypothetical protein
VISSLAYEKRKHLERGVSSSPKVEIGRKGLSRDCYSLIHGMTEEAIHATEELG